MTTSSRLRARLAADVGTTTPARLVRLRGELDAFSAPSLRSDLRRVIDACPALVAVDLTHLTALGVTGLSVLLEVRRLADERGTALLLVGSPAPPVVRLLGLVGWTASTEPFGDADGGTVGRRRHRDGG
ncbi:STAS domain-containing protein [Pseudonocardia sp. WMMC193]|uniref:STAS domain-containing protein n=1 Tax=Pseudonocardia sp. WMMC193 TaxID=2911965 RepID=UPI001F354BD7|nr:STAS domain-containing protein [Pseudonocardia sp. WMMC193]MCF7553622.1 STAS domain-containing protein [Pseudonocardia sp. WMMC193]